MTELNLKDEAPLRKKRKMADLESTRKNPIEIIDLEDDSFRFTPISNRGLTAKDAISVEQYSDDRDLALAIEASLSQLTNLDDHDLELLDLKPRNTPFHRRKKPFSHPSVTERGECSNSKPDPPFLCEICTETKPAKDSFNVPGCCHIYCRDCVIKYIESKLDEKSTMISCPVSNCTGSLDPENCLGILPKQVFERWGYALAEALVLGSKTIYCPYKDCSAAMVDDGGETVKESECVNCHRLFCAQCKAPWHDGVGCKEFQRLHKDEREREDILLKKLADGKMWRRCPFCRFYVEKISGCSTVYCRCGKSFIYI